MLKDIFYIDQLSLLMLFIVNVVGISILLFSQRYLATDMYYKKYMVQISALLISLSLLSVTNNIWLFLLLWAMSNTLLVQLIIHKKSWHAAKQSGIITAKYLFFGFIMISLGMTLLAYHAKTVSINEILNYSYTKNLLTLSLFIILLGIMTQSAIWPFNNWLISSVNAPTTVSALMHAGLVNGGGFLLARFFNLYTESALLLNFIFLLGIFSAILGSLAKLLQPDIKKMLACSTIGQMGFMFIEFGLGLIPAALAHICYHSFFKAYLFLRSASIVHEKKASLGYPPNLNKFLITLLISIPGIIAFSYVSHMPFTIYTTNFIVFLIVYITLIQACLIIISEKTELKIRQIINAIIFGIGFGSLYGFCLYTIENFLKPLHLTEHLPLTFMHIIGISTIIGLWLILLFSNFLEKSLSKYPLLQKIYVLILNWSQPNPKTITAQRNDYSNV